MIEATAAIVQLELENFGARLRQLVLSDHIRAEGFPRPGEAQSTAPKLGVVPLFERLRRLRLPGLLQQATDPATVWLPLVLPADARGRAQTVDVATGTALWYSAGIQVPIRWVLVRQPGKLSAFLSTDEELSAEQIVLYFTRRWAIETTFALVRAHLGVESQRQWSDNAIARTTPVLLGLFSLVTLLAHHLHASGQVLRQTSAWYHKAMPTFSDAIAAVRRYLWAETSFDSSAQEAVLLKVPQHQYLIWQEALAWAV